MENPENKAEIEAMYGQVSGDVGIASVSYLLIPDLFSPTGHTFQGLYRTARRTLP